MALEFDITRTYTVTTRVSFDETKPMDPVKLKAKISLAAMEQTTHAVDALRTGLKSMGCAGRAYGTNDIPKVELVWENRD